MIPQGSQNPVKRSGRFVAVIGRGLQTKKGEPRPGGPAPHNGVPGGLLPAKHPQEALLNLFEAPGVDQVLAVDHPGLDAAIEDYVCIVSLS
jgi:hypothetical protein